LYCIVQKKVFFKKGIIKVATNKAAVSIAKKGLSASTKEAIKQENNAQKRPSKKRIHKCKIKSFFFQMKNKILTWSRTFFKML
jgi:hypothetical protein